MAASGDHDDFTITLVSNASKSKKLYPANTVAKFKTRLHRQVELSGEYEIGVKEIQFPISFYNVQNSKDYNVDVLLDVNDNVVDVDGFQITIPQWEPYQYRVFNIPIGYYHNIQQILHQLNAIDMVAQNVLLKYDDRTGRVVVEQIGPMKINLSPKLRALLGFDCESGEKFLSAGSAPNPVNMNANVASQMFVYCDVVEPQLVGDSAERLLQAVGVEDVSKFGDLYVHPYKNPAYVPLLKNHFQTIEIDIKTYEDLPVPFEFGPSLVKVHIRKRRAKEIEREMAAREYRLTLVSNSSLSKKLYPNNTVSKFTTRLDRVVELYDGDYEIAITEIQFPISFYNVNSTDYYVDEFGLGEWDDIMEKHQRVVHDRVHLLKGNYSDVHHLLHYLNSVKSVGDNFIFEYNKDSGRVEVIRKTFSDGRRMIQLSPKLSEMLGFRDRNDNVHYDERYIREGPAPYPINLYANVHKQLFVYCDVVEPQLIGDSAERVLRVVGIEDVTKFGYLYARPYENPDYVPILKSHFHTIEIDIRTYEDLPAPFEFGPSLVKVHIRKRSST
jgi:hypothetical protein